MAHSSKSNWLRILEEWSGHPDDAVTHITKRMLERFDKNRINKRR